MSNKLPATAHVSTEFFRYFLVGGAAFVLDFSGLFLLTEYGGLHYLIGASLSFLVGVAFTYMLSVAWVFSHRRHKNPTKEFAIFLSIGLAGLALNAALMWALTDFAGFHYLLSKVGSAATIFIFNFAVRRTLLFRPDRKGMPA